MQGTRRLSPQGGLRSLGKACRNTIELSIAHYSVDQPVRVDLPLRGAVESLNPFAVSSMTADRVLVVGDAKHATSLRISNSPSLYLELLSKNNNTVPANLDEAPELYITYPSALDLAREAGFQNPRAFFRVIEA